MNATDRARVSFTRDALDLLVDARDRAMIVLTAAETSETGRRLALRDLRAVGFICGVLVSSRAVAVDELEDLIGHAGGGTDAKA